jgi:hypothetical protein
MENADDDPKMSLKLALVGEGRRLQSRWGARCRAGAKGT